MNKRVFVFGYGKHGRSLAGGLRSRGFRLTIIESNKKNHRGAKDDGYADTMFFDVTKDANLEALEAMPGDRLICVMDDEHLNVYLTLSLRPLFPECTILAISDSIYASQKLQMAGANKVIGLYEVSANRIHNLLKRPVSTRFLDKILSDKDGINFREIEVPQGSFLGGMLVDDVNFHACKVLLIGLVDMERGEHFEFITSGDEHTIETGDRIVCIGLEEDLDNFEKLIKKSEETVCEWP